MNVLKAENIAGRVTAQAVLRIQGSPTLRILQSSPYRVRPNERVRLECVAFGDQSPDISWRKIPYTGVDTSLISQQIDGKTVFEISNVSVLDTGTYKVLIYRIDCLSISHSLDSKCLSFWKYSASIPLLLV